MYARDTALIATPIGMVRVTGDDAALESIRIETDPSVPTAPTTGAASAVRRGAEQIAEYFAGVRTRFDLPLQRAAAPRGDALRAAIEEICYASTISYGDLARQAESSARAIGQACARNPFPIVIPCHRVVGAGGRLGHYSAGDGVRTKLQLLDLERLYQEKHA